MFMEKVMAQKAAPSAWQNRIVGEGEEAPEQLCSVMWADPPVVVAPCVAVVAKDLEPLGEVVMEKPLPHISFPYLPSVLPAIPIDMVYGEEKDLLFPTAGAFRAIM